MNRPAVEERAGACCCVRSDANRRVRAAETRGCAFWSSQASSFHQGDVQLTLLSPNVPRLNALVRRAALRRR